MNPNQDNTQEQDDGTEELINKAYPGVKDAIESGIYTEIPNAKTDPEGFDKFLQSIKQSIGLKEAKQPEQTDDERAHQIFGKVDSAFKQIKDKVLAIIPKSNVIVTDKQENNTYVGDKTTIHKSIMAFAPNDQSILSVHVIPPFKMDKASSEKFPVITIILNQTQRGKIWADAIKVRPQPDGTYNEQEINDAVQKIKEHFVNAMIAYKEGLFTRKQSKQVATSKTLPKNPDSDEKFGKDYDRKL